MQAASFPASAALVLGIAAGAAQASTVKFQTATSFGPNQVSAQAYQTVVNDALGQPDAFSTFVPLYDNLTSQGIFGGFNNNRASLITVSFAASAAQAGTWDLRFAGDYGYGAAVFLDGVALGFKSTSMWWNFSYADPTQSFQFASVPIAAGSHLIQVYGLEDCCDGGSQGQFRIGNGSYVTFGNGDGLVTGVPEPETYALMLLGLGAIGWLARPRQRG